MKTTELKELLDEKVAKYNHPSFLQNDPLGIPHRFSLKQDIEISGFFAAILAWGNRKSIINNCNRLMHLMDEKPHLAKCLTTIFSLLRTSHSHLVPWSRSPT